MTTTIKPRTLTSITPETSKALTQPQEAVPQRRLAWLGPVTAEDLGEMEQAIDEAEAALEKAFTFILTRAQQRDFGSVFSDTDHAWIRPFEPIATRFNRLEEALIILGNREHRLLGLKWILNAQR